MLAKSFGFIAAGLSFAVPAAAADWPYFGGLQRDMTTSETVAPKVLESVPPNVWKVEIGVGYSGPAVVGDAVYVMGYSKGEEHVRRLNAADGQPVWTLSYSGELIDNLNAGGPGATPTVAGDRLLTTGREGQVHCLNVADGSVLWRVDLGERFGVETPAWGFTGSPLVLGSKVIVDAGKLVALDLLTGQTLWESAPHKVGYGTPSPFEYGGRSYLAHFNNDGLSVADLNTGEEAAFVEFESQFDTAATTPIIEGDTLWISAGYDGACALFRFNGSSLEQIYRNKNIKNHFSNTVPVGKYLYGISGQTSGSRNCTLVCIDHATGKEMWSQRGGGFGSVIAASGNLIYLNDAGRAAVVKADPKSFQLLSSSELLDGQCWTAPVLANGVLYCRNSEGTLAAYRLEK